MIAVCPLNGVGWVKRPAPHTLKRQPRSGRGTHPAAKFAGRTGRKACPTGVASIAEDGSHDLVFGHVFGLDHVDVPIVDERVRRGEVQQVRGARLLSIR